MIPECVISDLCYKCVQYVPCVDVKAVGFWLSECWTEGSVMLGSRWPGTVDPVTLDRHCQFILEVPAKPECGIGFHFAKRGFL